MGLKCKIGGHDKKRLGKDGKGNVVYQCRSCKKILKRRRSGSGGFPPQV